MSNGNSVTLLHSEKGRGERKKPVELLEKAFQECFGNETVKWWASAEEKHIPRRGGGAYFHVAISLSRKHAGLRSHGSSEKKTGLASISLRAGGFVGGAGAYAGDLVYIPKASP